MPKKRIVILTNPQIIALVAAGVYALAGPVNGSGEIMGDMTGTRADVLERAIDALRKSEPYSKGEKTDDERVILSNSINKKRSSNHV